MTLQEIDKALADWDSRLDAAAQNLVDLQATPTYQQLTGSGGAQRLQLTGATAARVNPALDGMATVFQYYGLVKDLIGRASELRRNMHLLFGGDQKLHEIELLLTTKSISMAAVDVPLEDRTLLSGTQSVESFTPSELLNAMMAGFQAARDAVLAVDRAWRDLGSTLDLIGTRIANLRAQSGVLGGDALVELDAAQSTFQSMSASVQSDPLGVSSDLQGQIEPVLARLEDILATRERLSRQIASDLSNARNRLTEVLQLEHRTREACAEVREKIANCNLLPVPVAGEIPQGLAVWLDRLQEKYSGGMLNPVEIGLRNWNQAAEDYVEKEKAILAANCAPLDARNELRGRLEALKAKARAYGIAENDTMVELVQQAETLLYTQPAEIDRATAAVAHYEQSIRNAKSQSEI